MKGVFWFSVFVIGFDEVLDNSDVIVVGNGAPEFSEALKRTRADQVIIDLVRVKTDRAEIPGQYQGICW